MSNQKSGERTLLTSLLLSSPGPIVLGSGLLIGFSSTLLADFLRRSAELVAIIVSWVVFRMLHRGDQVDEEQKERLERIANLCVGAAMCLSGVAMIFVALFSAKAVTGNVVPGLVIALLGVTTNSWLFLRYYRLNREKPNAILAAQSKLYRAKSLVDICVVVALVCIAVAPDAPVTHYVDVGGSIVVASYLILNGIAVVRSKEVDTDKKLLNEG
jgi:divalent metal cation (Fe/Co/Zn/Cd) transporter